MTSEFIEGRRATFILAAATYNEIILTNVFSQNAGYVGGSIYGQTEKLTITGGMFNWHGALNNFGPWFGNYWSKWKDHKECLSHSNTV